MAINKHSITQNEFDSKLDKNTAITGSTKTKITYDANGLVTVGSDAGISDITGLQTALDGKQTLNVNLTQLAGLTQSGNEFKTITTDGTNYSLQLPIETYTTTERDALTNVPVEYIIYNSTDSVLQQYNGTTWDIIGSTGGVSSFNGRTGIVTPQSGDYTKSDVGLANVTNDAQVKKSDYTAKGDLLAGTGTSTYSALSLGTNGQVLTADNTQTNGVKWSNSTGGVTSFNTRTGAVTPQSGDYTASDVGAEPTITAGTTLQYWRGDKTFQTLDTSIVPENTNLYFTTARAIASTLTSFTVSGTRTAILATDTILQAFGKTQKYFNDLASVAFSGSATDLTTGTLLAARLPNPTASTLGGIESLAATTSKWIDSISTSGVPHASQPAFTDISGTATESQLPTATLFTDVSGQISALTEKTILADADNTLIEDSAASNSKKRTTFADIFTYISSKITGAISTFLTTNANNNVAIVSNGSGKLTNSTTTATEIGYVSGVTSAIQTQLNALASKSSINTFLADYESLYVDAINGSDSTGTGTVLNPFASEQGAINSFTAGSPYVIYVKSSTTGAITFRTGDQSMRIVYDIKTSHSGTITFVAGNTSIYFDSLDGSAKITGTINDACSGVIGWNCDMSGATYNKTGGGSGATTTGDIEFSPNSCLDSCTLNLSGNTTVRTLGKGAGFILAQSNGIVQLSHQGSAYCPTITGSPALFVLLISSSVQLLKNGSNQSLICSATPSVVGAVYLNGCSTYQPDLTTYGKIDFTGANINCLYYAWSNCQLASSGDILPVTGVQLVNYADYLSANYTPSNYTPTSNSVKGHLTGINTKLGATVTIAGGGTGQTTQQNAINALTNVSSATDEYVLTKDTATGNAIFKVAAAGGITALTGDVTASGSGSVAATIASNAVTNAKIAQKAAYTISGNDTSATANQSDLTADQVLDVINNGTSTTNSLAINRGGSGARTQQAAINALTGTQSSGNYLRSDGTNATLASIVAGDVPTLNQNTTGTALNITATSNSTLTTLPSLLLPSTQVTNSIATVTTGITISNAITLVNASGATTQTLPTAVGISGYIYTIKNINIGVVTVATTSSQTIDGATTFVFNNQQYNAISVISNGANWFLI